MPPYYTFPHLRGRWVKACRRQEGRGIVIQKGHKGTASCGFDDTNRMPRADDEHIVNSVVRSGALIEDYVTRFEHRPGRWLP